MGFCEGIFEVFMLHTLLQLLACAFIGVFNLYGVSRIYYQAQLFKKAGLVLFFMAVGLLLHYISRLVSPQVPPVLIFSLLLFVGAAFSSLLGKGHQRIFSGLHQYQLATHPKTWQNMMRAGDFFYARLVPALGTIAQATMIFH